MTECAEVVFPAFMIYKLWFHVVLLAVLKNKPWNNHSHSEPLVPIRETGIYKVQRIWSLSGMKLSALSIQRSPASGTRLETDQFPGV